MTEPKVELTPDPEPASVSFDGLPNVLKTYRLSNSVNLYNKKIYVGLKNKGNTCYLNAAVQFLSHCIPFVDYTLSARWSAVLPRNHRQRKSYPLCTSLLTILKVIWDDEAVNTSTKDPSVFVDRFLDLHPDLFTRLHQHDAHEALMVLIDDIHCSISRDVTVTMTQPVSTSASSTFAQVASTSAGSIDWNLKKQMCDMWQTFCDLDGYSELLNLFYGILQQKIRCRDCGFTEHSFEPFNSLNLNIRSTSDQTGLHELLSRYFTKVAVSATCTECNGSRKSRKITIARFPKILIITFQRFGSQGKKNKSKIMVPGITSNEHMCIDLTRFSSNDICGGNGDDQKSHRYVYMPVSCIVHSGARLDSGHYITLKRENFDQSTATNTRWIAYNDAKIGYMSTDQQDVDEVSSGIYVVGYLRYSNRRS